MLKIKLKKEDSSYSWYKIKVNGSLVDSGVLENNEETVGLGKVDFSNNDEVYISILGPVERQTYVNEIIYDQKDTECRISSNVNFNSDNLASGLIENINDILQDNFADMISSESIGGNLEWVFKLNKNGNISLWLEGENGNNWVTFSQEKKILNGYHKIEFLDGSVFEGNLENNFVTEEGKITYSDGTVYQGELLHQASITETPLELVPKGLGRVTYTNGTVHIGYFVHDINNKIPMLAPHDGKIIYSNGLTCQRNGSGAKWDDSEDSESEVCTFVNISSKNSSKVFDGIFKGIFVEDVSLGKGKIHNGNGDTFEWIEGTFQNGDLITGERFLDDYSVVEIGSTILASHEIQLKVFPAKYQHLKIVDGNIFIPVEEDISTWDRAPFKEEIQKIIDTLHINLINYYKNYMENETSNDVTILSSNDFIGNILNLKLQNGIVFSSDPALYEDSLEKYEVSNNEPIYYLNISQFHKENNQ